jgi:hypothetical protein
VIALPVDACAPKAAIPLIYEVAVHRVPAGILGGRFYHDAQLEEGGAHTWWG